MLASASPRRVDLLTAAGYGFTVEPADIDETPAPGEEPDPYARRLSADKAAAVARAKSHGQRSAEAAELVIGADTVVTIDGTIIGKPSDEAEARATLRRLSGVSHEVITAVTVHRVADGTALTDSCTTRVWFRELSDDAINEYVATTEPMDKAGSYAIQGGGAAFVERTDGPPDNVVGLPVELVGRLIEQVSRAGLPA